MKVYLILFDNGEKYSDWGLYPDDKVFVSIEDCISHLTSIGYSEVEETLKGGIKFFPNAKELSKSMWGEDRFATIEELELI